MKTFVAYNALTLLFFVRSRGFIAQDSGNASPLDEVEAAAVRATFLNVRTTQVA